MSAPKINITLPLAKALDIKRQLFQPADAALDLLDHKPAGQRGYTKIITVSDGWYFAGRTGQPGELHIAEAADATLARLQQARAFSLSGAVYKVESGTDAVTKPSNDARLVWKFNITPTGEAFDDEES